MAENLAHSQVVWAVLFIIGGAAIFRKYSFDMDKLQSERDEREKTIRESSEVRERKIIELYDGYKSDAKEREERLISHIERTTETLDRIEDSLKWLSREVDNVKNQVNKMK